MSLNIFNRLVLRLTFFSRLTSTLSCTTTISTCTCPCPKSTSSQITHKSINSCQFKCPKLGFSTMENSNSNGNEIYSVEFEVHGKVQGVFFRKYTQSKGNELELKGWCKNTSHGTVKGVMQGPRSKINEMKYWLEHKGSPSSRISKAEFGPEQKISEYKYQNFGINK